MGIGVDVGTMNIVVANTDKIMKQRNCYYKLDVKDNTYSDTLSTSQSKYVEYDNDVFIIGEDALRYSGISGNIKDYHRSMRDGVLNPKEENGAIILGEIIKSMVPPAKENGEVIAFTCPAPPLDGSFDTTYHEMVIKRILKSLGYKTISLNEARCLVFSDAPMSDTDEGPAPFSGIGLSIGGGMSNMAVVWKGNSIIEMSVNKGGDWIDNSVAKVTNSPVSMITIIKENELDLNKPVEGKNRKALEALQIYYDALIENICEAFEDKFNELKSTINSPLSIVVGGGTASVPGFIEKLKDGLSYIDLPFPIKDIKLVNNPLTEVASGALIAALNKESK